MRLYHSTSKAAASSILATGFIDNTDHTYGFAQELTGVWLADRPLDRNDGCRDDAVVLVIDLDLNGQDLESLEVRPLQPPYRRHREYLVPAGLINTLGKVTMHVEDNEWVDCNTQPASSERVGRCQAHHGESGLSVEHTSAMSLEVK